MHDNFDIILCVLKCLDISEQVIWKQAQICVLLYIIIHFEQPFVLETQVVFFYFLFLLPGQG